ncbi:MAG TPA: hypothetical protein VF974_06810 [Patescibacteria group bacterium]
MKVTLVRFHDLEFPDVIYFSAQLPMRHDCIQCAVASGSHPDRPEGDSAKVRVMRRLVNQPLRWDVVQNNSAHLMHIEHAVAEVTSSDLYDLRGHTW